MDNVEANQVLHPTLSSQDATYEGDMDDAGIKEGHGVEHFGESGDTYEGGFKHGRKAGLGVYRFADNSSHEGYYKEGKRSGPGIFRLPDGRALVGHFNDDLLQGQFLLWGPVGLFGRASCHLVTGESQDPFAYTLSKPEALAICASFGFGVPPTLPTAFRGKQKSGLALLIANVQEQAEKKQAEMMEAAQKR